MKGTSLSLGEGVYVCFLGWPSVFGRGGPGSDVWEGCHRAGQTKAFPRVTPIREVAPNGLTGRMAQKGARPRGRPIRKVAQAGLDGALWPNRGRTQHFECHLAGWLHFWPSWEAFWLLGTCCQWIWELKTRVLSTLAPKMASKPAF